ncbi:energy-coupling factor transporter transmembrane component T family protein [Mogibacterium timidum]
MIKDITLGQYYPVESLVHRLEARSKVLGVLAYLVGLFVVNNFWGFVIAAVAVGTVIKLSGVPFSYMMRGLKAILLILLFTMVLNVFMMDGTILWQWKFLKITYEGLYRAAFMGIRLVLLIIGTSLLTFCTKPTELTDGLEKLLSPFARVGLPAHEIALMMTIALRFIPVLMDEADKIMKAQQSRGADFESGNIFQRAKSLIPIIVPLFVSSFRIAGDLALAMEARCYRGGNGRTKLKESRFAKRDAVWGIALMVFLCALFATRYI